METTQISNWAQVGDLLSWTSAAGFNTGIVRRIDRNKKTAHKTKRADYYSIQTGTNWAGTPITSYLNSHAMHALKVIVQQRNEGAPESKETPKKKKTAPITRHDFQVGDGVNWSAGTDVHAGTVSKVTPSKVYVVQDEKKLLNGCESDATDALQFSPGGFVGHMSGTQRYEFTPGDPQYVIIFSYRKNDDNMKMKGTSSRGSMRSWGVLRKGRQAHYDFNF